MAVYRSINLGGAIAALIFCGFLTVGQVSAGEGKDWSGKDIMAKFVGNTLVGKNNIKGYKFKVFYRTDGTVKIFSSKADWSGTDEGKWEIDGDKVCLQWSKFAKGKRFCRTVSSNGETIVFHDLDGEPISTAKIEKGNPHDL